MATGCAGRALRAGAPGRRGRPGPAGSIPCPSQGDAQATPWRAALADPLCALDPRCRSRRQRPWRRLAGARWSVAGGAGNGALAARRLHGHTSRWLLCPPITVSIAYSCDGSPTLARCKGALRQVLTRSPCGGCGFRACPCNGPGPVSLCRTAMNSVIYGGTATGPDCAMETKERTAPNLVIPVSGLTPAPSALNGL